MPQTKTNHLRNLLRGLAISFLLCSVGWQSQHAFTLDQATSAGTDQPHPRDGSHDFDFNIGVWHTHIRRVLDPFSASSDVIELDGTFTVRPVWGAREVGED